MLTATLKPKACAFCKSAFMPVRPMQRVCSPTCARRTVEADKKAEKAQIKARKRDLETVPQLIKEAQHEFNAYRRLADKIAGHPCISCGRPLNWGTEGGSHQVDCGHYRSTGSASHLRFDEDNAHAQCVNCNRYGAGRAVDYRLGLIARIGLERVERLEAANDVVKWDRDTLRQIKTIYRAKLRDLKKERS
ncbi:recombination protein NinG [Variovorax saccharolyticus]|uniref:recombination protein NinG n=1 Tax=Variovorax saccharolyticus TaxID=3053516 RepID=UPI0025789B19|nr:recombination protein NinG [Variovorax sp. J31P216]MDM0024096.1 recombination protein NinG [Variovorax sp. J31P216]